MGGGRRGKRGKGEERRGNGRIGRRGEEDERGWGGGGEDELQPHDHQAYNRGGERGREGEGGIYRGGRKKGKGRGRRKGDHFGLPVGIRYANIMVVSSPDFIGTYIDSSITRAILKAIHTVVGFGSGTKTNIMAAKRSYVWIPLASQDTSSSDVQCLGLVHIAQDI